MIYKQYLQATVNMDAIEKSKPFWKGQLCKSCMSRGLRFQVVQEEGHEASEDFIRTLPVPADRTCFRDLHQICMYPTKMILQLDSDNPFRIRFKPPFHRHTHMPTHNWFIGLQSQFVRHGRDCKRCSVFLAGREPASTSRVR